MIASGATTSGDDGERLVTLNRGDNPATVRYRLRGLDGKVLREYTYSSEGSTWSWDKYSIWRGSQLLGTASSSERRHFHLDHLGSARLITDDNASVVAEHTDAPFGEEVSIVVGDGEPMKVTGHERDQLGSTGTTAHLDSMPARYYNPHLGRFLSVDPVGGEVGSSQSWNRYGYVRNAPLAMIDSYGASGVHFAGGPAWQREGRKAAVEFVATGGLVNAVSAGRSGLSVLRSGLSSLRGWFTTIVRARAIRLALRYSDKAVRFEGEVAHALGNHVQHFQRMFWKTTGGKLCEIDGETSRYVIEATIGESKSLRQITKLVGNKIINPKGKPVIVVAPNLRKNAAKKLEEAGATVVRTVEEMKKIVLE